MRKVLEGGLYAIPAAIHLLPLYGLLGAGALTALYGLDFADPSLQVLMRHRAVLFGIVGGLLGVAAFRPALRPAAQLAGFGSVLSFLALAYGTEGANAAVMKVAAVDLVALACLVAAAILHARARAAASAG